MNNENLIPVRSKKEAREKGKKGGIESAKARKEKKLFKEVVRELLSQDIPKEKLQEIKNFYPGVDIDGVCIRTLIANKQIQKALNGDTKACLLLLDMSGEKPKEEIEPHETKLPIFNFEIVDNSKLEREFMMYEEADRTGKTIEEVRARYNMQKSE